jgi:hypothetical protein
LSQLEDRQLLSTFMVSNTAVNGKGSLRQAMIKADYSGGDNTIVFGSLFNTAQTISIGRNELLIANTHLTFKRPKARVTVLGGGSNRIFEIAKGASAVISNMTITGGYPSNNGGGISNNGTLTLNNCTVTHCTAHAGASRYGGGLYNMGTVTLNNCTFSYDTVVGDDITGEGGGLYNNKVAIVNNCTFSNDRADGFTGYGGAIYSNKPTSVSNITFNNNWAKTKGPNIYP